MSAPLFLGLDLSTQALKASLLDEHLAGIDELGVRFDTDLPSYHTTGGVLPSDSELLRGVPDAVGAPVRMYVAAFDLLWERAAARGWEMHRIAAISAAGMQHASVYLAKKALDVLASPDDAAPLGAQLDDAAFSRAIVPNWQDASTRAECAQLTRLAEITCAATAKSVHGRASDVPALSRITGSTAQTRFTAAQIMRFRRDEPDAYANTARIALVSNFVASLLCAGSSVGVAPLDESDACGMNLLDMADGKVQWNESLLALVAGACDAEGRAACDASASASASAELKRKLGTVACDPTQPVGTVGTWLQKRYGLQSSCIVCLSTGDNPATLQCIAPRHGEAVVSLGTSDTAFVPSRTYAPSVEHHTFAHPASLAHAGTNYSLATPPYFLMLVFKNGSLAREWVRDTYCDADWSSFDKSLCRTDACDATGFYWLRPEIIPYDARGVHRFVRDNGDDWTRVESFDDPLANAAAIVMSQCMAIRVRIGQILGDTPLERVYVVGGAAQNRAICSMLADVLGCQVVRPLVSGHDASGERIEYNFTSVGAACRARWVYECSARKKRGESLVSYEETIALARGDTCAYEVAATPRNSSTYAAFESAWRTLEQRALNESV
ncbi:xylulokinase [Malassezia cuniculi]|uniref:Xylulose kinase n=1 Tax=Malassezia cuniculi TaxID=948313 RepID=A0AAF0ETL2_9BASI|nr:xylulokinase [Malassezia cuniculi]